MVVGGLASGRDDEVRGELAAVFEGKGRGANGGGLGEDGAGAGDETVVLGTMVRWSKQRTYSTPSSVKRFLIISSILG